MVSRLQPISQHDFLCLIQGYQKYFSTFSGVEITAENSTFNDGLSKTNRTVLGPKQHSNVTLSGPYDPVADAAFIEAVQNLWYERQDLTVTIEPVRRTRDGTERIGERSWTLQGCQVLRFMMSEVDTESSDVSMMELELSVDAATYN